MQFTTVRSKEKDYDIYLKSEKLFHSHEKTVSQPFESGKNWFLAISSRQTLLQLFGQRKKWICRDLTTLGKRKKILTSIQSEKLVHSQQEHEKNVSRLKKLVPSYFDLTNTVSAIWRDKKVDHCCSYLETKKCSSQLLGARKKLDIYLKSEKLVHSQQEHEKNVSQLFESGVPSYFEPDKHCCNYLVEKKAIWRPKNVVHNCQEQGKRL